MEQNLSAKNFLDPKEVLKQINIVPGNVAADFGCGAGFFSLALAELIGEKGKVYSLDILPSALESIESKAKIAGLANIVARRVNLEKEKGSGLENDSVDLIIMKDILFQNKMKDVIVEEAFRVLKTGGKAIIVEWNNVDSAIGPKKEIRISEEDLKKLAENQGFNFEKTLVVGDFHYGAVFAKN